MRCMKLRTSAFTWLPRARVDAFLRACRHFVYLDSVLLGRHQLRSYEHGIHCNNRQAQAEATVHDHVHLNCFRRKEHVVLECAKRRLVPAKEVDLVKEDLHNRDHDQDRNDGKDETLHWLQGCKPGVRPEAEDWRR